MSTYLELKTQAEALFAQAEQARKHELSVVIAEIKEKMKEYNLSIADLSGSETKTKRSAKSKSEALAKYRGPNGELWAGGLGRKPAWINALLAEGKNLDDFLI